MYSPFQLEPPSTYPFDVSWLSTGSALTAAHFCQTATKVSKKALPYLTAASPGLGGALTPALLWAFALSEQSHYKIQKQKQSWTDTQLPRIRPAGRPPRRLLIYRPPGGRVEVLWSGPPGMDAGRAAMGHGWPVAACPRNRTGAREPERSEGRTMGQGLFGSFCGCLTKGTRRKGETNISVICKCRICTRWSSCHKPPPQQSPTTLHF